MLMVVKHCRQSQAALMMGVLPTLIFAVTAHAEPATLSWAKTPNAADVQQVYPAAALESRATGHTLVSCGLLASGEPANCVVVHEDPAGQGFGSAALSLAAQLRAATPVAPALLKSQHAFSIPITFEPPPAVRPLRYKVLPGYKAFGPPGPYFPDRAERAHVGGRATMDCAVRADSRLTDCLIVSETPLGADFGAAALRMAKDGWITADPAPVPTGERDIARFVIDFGRAPKIIFP